MVKYCIRCFCKFSKARWRKPRTTETLIHVDDFKYPDDRIFTKFGVPVKKYFKELSKAAQ